MNDILSLNPCCIFFLMDYFFIPVALFISVVFQAKRFWTDVTGTDMSVYPSCTGKAKELRLDSHHLTRSLLASHRLFPLPQAVGLGSWETKQYCWPFWCSALAFYWRSTPLYTKPICLVIGPPIIQSKFLLFTDAKTHHLQPKFPLKGLLQLQQPEYIRSGPVYHIG